MKTIPSNHMRVLGLAPSSNGCGFAVMEGNNVLAAWGLKVTKGGRKSFRSLSHVGNLIAQYQPDVIAIEDARSHGSRRSPRIKALIGEIVSLAREEDITVKRYSRKQVNLDFLSDERGTKHALAQYLAARFPEELGLHLPPKRKLWMSERSGMDIFDAVALAQHFLRGREQG